MATKSITLPDQPILGSHLRRIDHRNLVQTDILDECFLVHCSFDGISDVRIDASRLEDVRFSDKRMQRLSIVDVVVFKLEAAGMQAIDVRLSRVCIENSRLSGADLGEALIEDCVYSNAKLNEINFKATKLTRSQFINCDLSGADFSGAWLEDVVFTDCSFERVKFDNAKCKRVDLRKQELRSVSGVLGLKGSLITGEQTLQLAPLLATEAGFQIEDIDGDR